MNSSKDTTPLELEAEDQQAILNRRQRFVRKAMASIGSVLLGATVNCQSQPCLSMDASNNVTDASHSDSTNNDSATPSDIITAE